MQAHRHASVVATGRPQGVADPDIHSKGKDGMLGRDPPYIHQDGIDAL